MNKLFLLLIPALLLSACVRENFLAVPDRGGHDWNLGGEGGQNPGAVSTTYRRDPDPGRGEEWYLLEEGETLWMVAEKFNMQLYDLIERNDFTVNPYPAGKGLRVIVRPQ